MILLHAVNFLYQFGKDLPGFYSYYYDLFQRLCDSRIKLSVITHLNFLKEHESLNSLSVYKAGSYRRKYEKNPIRWLSNTILNYSNPRMMTNVALKLHEKEPIDLMNAYHSISCGLAALHVKAKTGVPVIFNPITGLRHLFFRPPQLRNFPHIKHSIKKSSFLDRSFTRFYSIFGKSYFKAFPRIFKYSNLIIVPSCASKRDVLYFGADPEKIAIIPFAVDTNEFSPNDVPHNELEQLRKGNSPLMLFVGRLSITEKAVDEVLKAFKLIRKTYPDSRLVIVGEGPDKKALVNLSYRLGLIGSVFFVGSKRHSEIPQIMSTADILLLPFKLDSYGLTADTFGRVIIEGMSCGKVVVTTDAEPFNEIIENNKNGFLVQAGDYQGIANITCKILLDEPCKREIEKNARRKAERRYSFPIIKNKLINTYKELVY